MFSKSVKATATATATAKAKATANPFSRSFHVYVLKCQERKWYIGKSNNVLQRFEDHVASKGANWTRIYRPIRIEKVYDDADVFEEDRVTKEFMVKYGVENVRGGSYTTFALSHEQLFFLQQEFRTATSICFLCGQYGHFAWNCKGISYKHFDKKACNPSFTLTYKKFNLSPELSMYFRMKSFKP
jgi:cellular nucleic acid-binding protein